MKAQAAPDVAGIAVSLLCAFHCAATPLFFAALAIAGLRFADESLLEWGFLATTLVIGTVALVRGAQRHGRRHPIAWFVGGVALLVAARFVREDQETLELALVVAGAAGVVIAHLRNWRAQPHTLSR